MSFQNLNWHSRVEAASRSPLIPPSETFLTPTGANPRTEERLVREAKEKTAQSSPSGTRQRGIVQEQENRSPAFCGQRRLEPPLVVVFLFRHCRDEDEPKFPQVSASAKR